MALRLQKGVGSALLSKPFALSVRRKQIPVFAPAALSYHGCIHVALAKQSFCLSRSLPLASKAPPPLIFFSPSDLLCLALGRCTGVRTAYLRPRLELQVKLKIPVHGRGYKRMVTASRDRILSIITVVIHCPAASHSQDKAFTRAAYLDTC